MNIPQAPDQWPCTGLRTSTDHLHCSSPLLVQSARQHKEIRRQTGIWDLQCHIADVRPAILRERLTVSGRPPGLALERPDTRHHPDQKGRILN